MAPLAKSLVEVLRPHNITWASTALSSSRIPLYRCLVIRLSADRSGGIAENRYAKLLLGTERVQRGLDQKILSLTSNTDPVDLM